MKKIIKILFLTWIVLLTLTSCQKDENNIDLSKICTQNWWTWLKDFWECEYLSKEICEQNNWKFFECESACRNNPKAEMCTMQCVQVCKFWQEKK